MSSWLNPKIEKRVSPIQGHGLFGRDTISAGEIVAVKGGTIMDSDAFVLVRGAVSPAEIQIEEGFYIAPGSAEKIEANILCLYHSCPPNVGVRDQITFVAMYDIPAGAELTIDYAMIDSDPDERMACSCGAREWRKIITGNNWRLQELQQRYAGYFSRSIHERFDQWRSQ